MARLTLLLTSFAIATTAQSTGSLGLGEPSTSLVDSATSTQTGSIPAETFGQTGVNASSYTYVANGSLTVPQPKPYTPAGAFGNNGSLPVYHPLSDFDYQSLSLALYQEWIELDLFHYGLATFSDAEFDAAGIDQNGRFLIQTLADQEVGHATLISNMLGSSAPEPCEYQYPFTTVKGFIDFCARLTRWGESGVYGFLNRLDSRAAAQLLLQSIATEARQQLIFRQLDGLEPVTEWFIPGATQSMSWTLLAPYIKGCPARNLGPRRLAWQNFPALNITNGPSVVPPYNTTEVFNASLTPSHNRTTPISAPFRNVSMTYDAPGQLVGPNSSYVTSTGTLLPPTYVAWISQLNVTFSPFVMTGNNSGYTLQPNGTIWPAVYGQSPLVDNVKKLGTLNDPSSKELLNGTVFVMLVDALTPALNLTPFNLSNINQHIVAGPAMYLVG
ncbi:ferritin-like domain-domain-containing protein [Protomyces lactucae-debilis]|uniref:Ferritin-like domain-domain-containing protein n=1 Tax=Protomyces lactucae-debilis TaxID=2754530 RepID=A0A1Y2FLY9_PROLT|nr:ferritin-like domain-containing protein [Protomyces lactucae-debilis]ORY84992.1 ferritin-like domain-domain-containing protein [Protomyces lactucae-debilis]